MVLLDVYRAQLTLHLASQLQYRAELLIYQLSVILEPVIYLTVWSAVARSSGGSVGSFGPGEFAAYFLVAMLVNHATRTWTMYEFEYRVRQGTLSAALLLPVHPIHNDAADNLASKLLTASVLLPTAAALMVAFGAVLSPDHWEVAAFAPALLLAFALRFLVEWVVALTAFWMTRTGAINQAYYAALLFLSGLFAPPELLPGPIAAVASALPFRWMLAFPTELLLGRTTPRQAAIGFAAQVAWLLLALALAMVVWRAGLRRYSAVGS